MIKIIQDYKNCIGCGTCVALCPKFWEIEDNGKARPKNSKSNSQTGEYELEIEERDLDCNKEAEEFCPAGVIKII
ncbi:MAG: ferredoxin [Patescibacteria group bacterium]